MPPEPAEWVSAKATPKQHSHGVADHQPLPADKPYSLHQEAAEVLTSYMESFNNTQPLPYKGDRRYDWFCRACAAPLRHYEDIRDNNGWVQVETLVHIVRLRAAHFFSQRRESSDTYEFPDGTKITCWENPAFFLMMGSKQPRYDILIDKHLDSCAKANVAGLQYSHIRANQGHSGKKKVYLSESV